MYESKSLVLLPLRGVMTKQRRKSHTSVYTDVARGLLTKPVRCGARSSGWPEYEVDAVTAYRIAGKSDDEIRELVVQLHSHRAALADAAQAALRAMTMPQPKPVVPRQSEEGTP
jgi:prophage regulatory protein